MQQIIFLLISMAIQYAARPKQQNAKPAGLGDFNLPTAEDGREIPELIGTRELKSANWVWYGDLRTKPIKKAA